MCAEYVNHGAKLKCTCGSIIANIQILPDRTVTLTNGQYANISDHQSMVNIPPFGVCRSLKYPPTKSATDAHHGTLTPMPCKPGTYSVWENGNDTYIIRNFPALLTCSSCRCIFGGVITIVTDGQIPNEYESEQVKTLQQEAKEEASETQDGAGLDVIDFIPVVGSIRDIGEGLAAGSMGMVALGTVFLVADVVGIVGSVFSGGAATVGVTAAKSSIKAGVKVAAKTVAKESAQQAVKQGEKKLLEVTAKTTTEQAAKQSGKSFLELTARGATEGATKLSVEAAEELGEEAFKELSVNIFKPNIFKVETKIAETGAKETAKSPAAISQISETLKPIGDSSKGILETGMKQIDDIAKAGREFLNACGDVAKKEAERIVNDFKSSLPQIKQWRENKVLLDQAKKNGFL